MFVSFIIIFRYVPCVYVCVLDWVEKGHVLCSLFILTSLKPLLYHENFASCNGRPRQWKSFSLLFLFLFFFFFSFLFPTELKLHGGLSGRTIVVQSKLNASHWTRIYFNCTGNLIIPKTYFVLVQGEDTHKIKQERNEMK